MYDAQCAQIYQDTEESGNYQIKRPQSFKFHNVGVKDKSNACAHRNTSAKEHDHHCNCLLSKVLLSPL